MNVTPHAVETWILSSSHENEAALIVVTGVVQTALALVEPGPTTVGPTGVGGNPEVALTITMVAASTAEGAATTTTEVMATAETLIVMNSLIAALTAVAMVAAAPGTNSLDPQLQRAFKVVTLFTQLSCILRPFLTSNLAFSKCWRLLVSSCDWPTWFLLCTQLTHASL